jgi:hypothetical protein
MPLTPIEVLNRSSMKNNAIQDGSLAQYSARIIISGYEPRTKPRTSDSILARRLSCMTVSCLLDSCFFSRLTRGLRPQALT